MTLDYLQQQRDTPDPELLKRLGWSAEQLQAFTDRWLDIRDRGQRPDAQADSYDQEIRALGLRPPTADASRQQGKTDELRGLREEGFRAPPPAPLQSAFERFRAAAEAIK